MQLQWHKAPDPRLPATGAKPATRRTATRNPERLHKTFVDKVSEMQENKRGWNQYKGLPEEGTTYQIGVAAYLIKSG